MAGLWNISIAHGKVAGYNIAGKDYVYQHIVPVTTLNAFNISLFSMGCVDESKVTNMLIEENNEEQYMKVFIREDKIVGAIVIGNTKRSPILKAAIEKEISMQSMDFSNISVNELLNNIQNK